ncbi:MAG: hypothetical protein WKF85_05035 [Chitinophagaceae bacterium]
MDRFVGYESWVDLGKYISVSDFGKWHTVTGRNIIKVFVVPMVLRTLLTIALFWFRPTIIPQRYIWVLLICQLINIASTSLIQVPIQFQLDKEGYSIDLLNRLLSTDWLRKILLVLEAGITIILTNKILNQNKN